MHPNEMSANTRVLLRFLRQKENFDEWEDYYIEWKKYLSFSKGDAILRFDVHNWGSQESLTDKNDLPKDVICSYIFERFYIFSNGEIGFCCADEDGFFKMGNIFNSNPIEIFNNDFFLKYRKFMLEGKIRELEKCKICTVPQKKLSREFITN